ncbi:MAG: hypothetical protein AAF926_06580, partial [Pseudomonadota bacterium]
PYLWHSLSEQHTIDMVIMLNMMRVEEVIKPLRDLKAPERPFYLLLVILLIQFLYWFVLTPAFQRTAPSFDRFDVESLSVAVIDAPDWSALNAIEFQTLESPYRYCCEAGYRLVRVAFNLDTVPDQGLGEVPIIGATNYQTRLNGTLVWAEGQIHLDDLTAHGRIFRGINHLPAGLLREGSNELTYLMTAAPGAGGFHFGTPILGTYQETVAGFDFRRFLLNDYGLISYTIGYLIALFALIAWLRGGRDPYLFWLAITAFAWSSKLYYQTWDDPIVGGRGLATIGSVFALLLATAWVNLANHMAGRSIRWVLPLSLLGFVLAMVLSVIDIWSDGASRSVERIGYWFIGGGALASTILLLRKLPGLERQYYWEFAIYLMLVLMLMRDSFTRLSDILRGVETDFALPFLMVALVIAFITRNIQLFRSQDQLNQTLQAELNARTAELEAAHARESAFLRRQAHQDERQRIMRDMHDGLGSSLMSMLLAARRDKIDSTDVASGLENVIDEMRLMVDSMDSVGESLPAALALFRERAQTRVTDSGFTFAWDNQSIVDKDEDALPPLDSRSVLQVFRILQEAITNALKHSDGDRIAVTVMPNRIIVNDNGSVLNAPRVGGRGLANMEARAKSIGARFSIDHGSEGTSVKLDLLEPEAC